MISKKINIILIISESLDLKIDISTGMYNGRKILIKKTKENN